MWAHNLQDKGEGKEQLTVDSRNVRDICLVHTYIFQNVAFSKCVGFCPQHFRTLKRHVLQNAFQGKDFHKYCSQGGCADRKNRDFGL